MVDVQSPSGWYEFGDDPSLERFFDGDSWTDLKRPAVLRRAAGETVPPSDERDHSTPAAPAANSPGPSPGWYPDPLTGMGRRYWDGSAWTSLTKEPEPPPTAAPTRQWPGLGSYIRWILTAITVFLLAAGGWAWWQDRDIQNSPKSCSDIEAAVVRVSVKEYGEDSPLRFTNVLTPTPIDEAQLQLSPDASSGISSTFTKPDIICSAIGVFPDGSSAPIVFASGPDAKMPTETIFAYWTMTGFG